MQLLKTFMMVNEMFGMILVLTLDIGIHFGRLFLVAFLEHGEIIGALPSPWYNVCLLAGLRMI